jgi:hypothetical protein
MHSKPSFYKADKTLVNHDEVKINWVNEHTYEKDGHFIQTGCSTPFIVDAQQAVAALHDAGVKGYTTKAQAKEFTKKLASGAFKYLKIVDRTYDSETKRLAREMRK